MQDRNSDHNENSTTQEHKEELSKTEARQGQKGFNLRVLLISIPLIVLAFIAIYVFAEFNDRENPTSTVPSLNSEDTTVPPASD